MKRFVGKTDDELLCKEPICNVLYSVITLTVGLWCDSMYERSWVHTVSCVTLSSTLLCKFSVTRCIAMSLVLLLPRLIGSPIIKNFITIKYMHVILLDTVCDCSWGAWATPTFNLQLLIKFLTKLRTVFTCRSTPSWSTLTSESIDSF